MNRPKSSRANRHRQRHMAQSPPATPVLVRHGILKGFAVSMAISAAFLALLMVAGAWIPNADSGFVFMIFVSVFIVVNVAVAAYYKRKNQAVWNYLVGVAMAVGVDIWLGFILLDAVTVEPFILGAGAGG